MAKPQGNKARKRDRRPQPETALRMRMESASDPTGIAKYSWVRKQNSLLFQIRCNAVLKRWGRGKAISAFIIRWLQQNPQAEPPRDWEIESLEVSGMKFGPWVEQAGAVKIISKKPKRVTRKEKMRMRYGAQGDAYRAEMEEARKAAEPARKRTKALVELREKIERIARDINSKSST